MASLDDDANEIVAGLMSGPMLDGDDKSGETELPSAEGAEDDGRMAMSRMLAGEILDAVKGGNTDALARALLQIADLS